MKYFKFTLAVLLLSMALSTAAYGLHATVIKKKGSAEFLKSGEGTWQEVKKGLRLYSGDSVKTGESSSVDVAFDSSKNNLVSIRPRTHVVLKITESEKIELIDGEVFALVKRLPPGSSFEVRTPTAVCGARGTGWGAETNKDISTVSSYEDTAYARGVKKNGMAMEGETDIPEGYESTVRKLAKPSPAGRISEEKYGKWDKWRGIGTRRTKTERLVQNLHKIEEQKERIEERITEDRVRDRDESSGAGASQDTSKRLSSGN